MNKQECRKHFNPAIKLDVRSGILYCEKVEFIVCAAVKNIARRRTLILYLYNRQKVVEGCCEPEYTVFQCKDDYVTLQNDNGKEKWREASLYNIGKKGIDTTRICAFYRLKDEQLVTGFCNIQDKIGFNALEALQSDIMYVRATKRKLKREQKIIDRMKPIPSIPRGVKGWIHRDVLPHYIFYQYHRGDKPRQGYCTACRHDVLVSGARHNGKGKCPNCRKEITYKSNGKAKNVWDRATVQVMQKVGENELVLRIFKVMNGLRDYRQPHFCQRESMRIFIRYDNTGKTVIEPYYYDSVSTHWKEGNRPRFSYYQYSFEGDMCGNLYCRNLKDDLKDTPWQYSQIERFCNTGGEPFEVFPYFSAYTKYPAIEYLVKLGLTNLTCAIVYKTNGARVVNKNGKNLRETLGIEPNDLPMLQKINADDWQFELYQKLKQIGVRASENLLLWQKDNNIVSSENILIPLKYTTQNKLMLYIAEQYEKLKDFNIQSYGPRYKNEDAVLSNYKDYLIMGKMLEYDFTSSCALFPNNLQEAHDQTSKLYNAKKNGLFDKVISSAYKGLLEKYCFTKGGLTLIPPKTAKEIINEGHTLHHCVHSYVERVAKGECIIFFIRQTDNIKKPFYTLEVRSNRVIQINGKNHSAPTPEVEKFLKLWEHKKLWASG